MAYLRQELFPGLFKESDDILECTRLKFNSLLNAPNRPQRQAWRIDPVHFADKPAVCEPEYYDSIYQDDELSSRAKVVLIYLRDHANKQGTCWPGINTIAAGVSLSRSTVKRALDDLAKAGVVEKSNRRRKNGSLTSNLYRVK